MSRRHDLGMSRRHNDKCVALFAKTPKYRERDQNMNKAISWRTSATLKPDRAALSIARWIMLGHTLRNSKRSVALATVKDVQGMNV
jgi:hypothetical protein